MKLRKPELTAVAAGAIETTPIWSLSPALCVKPEALEPVDTVPLESKIVLLPTAEVIVTRLVVTPVAVRADVVSPPAHDTIQQFDATTVVDADIGEVVAACEALESGKPV